MEATYRTSYEGALGRPTVPDAAGLVRLIGARTDLEFERRARGSATVVAVMTWQADGSVLFEGLTGSHRLTPAGEAGFDARVAAHWEGFTQAQEIRNEADRARLGDLPSHRTAYLSPAGGLVAVGDAATLRDLVAARVDLEFGEHAPQARLVAVVARLRWDAEGGFVLRGRSGERAHPPGLDPAAVADLWTAFAGQEARARLLRLAPAAKAA